MYISSFSYSFTIHIYITKYWFEFLVLYSSTRLSFLYAVVYIFNPKLLIYPSPSTVPFGKHKFVCYVCGYISVLYIS